MPRPIGSMIFTVLVIILTHLPPASGFGLIGGVVSVGAVGGFLGWAFQGVGPSSSTIPTQTIPDLNAVLVGTGP